MFVVYCLNILNLFRIFVLIIYYYKCKKSTLIRNSNPHIRITRLNNIYTLIITIFIAIALFLFFIKSKFLVFISRSSSAKFFYIKIF